MAPERLAAREDTGLIAILSPPLERDIEAIARWHKKAVVLAGSLAPLSELLDSTGPRRTLVLSDGTNQEPVGLILMALDDPEPGWVTVALLAIAGPERRDLAAWAVAMLEARLRGEASHIRAGVPPDVGLALYFWLRLGYRPVVSGQGLWMISDLEA